MLSVSARCDRCEAALPLEAESDMDWDEQVTSHGWVTVKEPRTGRSLDFCSTACVERWAAALKPRQRKRAPRDTN